MLQDFITKPSLTTSHKAAGVMIGAAEQRLNMRQKPLAHRLEKPLGGQYTNRYFSLLLPQ